MAFVGPLLTVVYFVWRYKPFEQKLLGAVAVVSALFAFVGLMELLPCLVVLLNVPGSAAPARLQELAVVYVHKHFARSSFVSTRVGIRYRDSVLRFETSRINYFLLRDKKSIRAEIGQITPRFYYIRHLQLEPGERDRARQAYWLYWWSGVGKAVGFMALLLLAGWLLSLFLKTRKKIHL